MPAKARTLAKGSLLRILNFFLNAIVAFAMMPFVIHSLGDKMYGLWIFIGSFLDFYGLFDLGFGSAVQRYVSRALGNDDFNEANIVINTSLFLFSIIGIVTFLFSLAAAFLAPVFVKNITDVILFKEIIIILGLSLALSFPMKVFSGILTSHLRYDLLTTIGILKLIIRTLLIIVFLKLGYGVLALAFITLGTDLFAYALSCAIAKKTAKFINFSRQLITTSRIRTLFHYSIFTFINQIADRLRFGIDNFVITIFLGLNYVTIYSISSRLVFYFIDFIGTAIGVMTPVFSQYEGKGDYDAIKEKFILTTKISSYMSILIGAILLIFGKALIVRWMGKEYELAYPILVVLVIPVVVALMQNPSIQLVYGISKHKFYAISNSAEGACNLILSLIFVKKFGLIGVAIGTAVPMIIIKLFIQPIYTCKILKLGVFDYYFQIIIPALIKSSFVIFIMWLTVKKFLIPDYFNLAILILLVSMFSALIIFSLGFTKQERIYFKRIVLP